MNSVTVGEVRREKGDVAMERKRTSVGPPCLRPTALASGKTPCRITWSRKVLQRYPLYHTLSYQIHCDPLYLAVYCSRAKGRCRAARGRRPHAREAVEEAAVRGKACQLFFRIKNVITHKPKTKLNSDCIIKFVSINTSKLDLT
jgi:hypothetical protein